MGISSSPFLTKVVIDALFNTKRVSWDISKPVSVLFGGNGSGKSTILKIIDCALNRKENPLLSKKARLTELTVSGVKVTHNFRAGMFDKNVTKKFISELEASLADSVSEEHKKAVYSALELMRNIESGLSKLESINLESRLNVEYLSTFDMMILSKQEYDSVSDDVYTQLDFEIKKEITEMTKKLLFLSHKSAEEIHNHKASFNRQRVSEVFTSNFKKVNEFTSCVNEFLSDSNKSLRISDDGSFIISQKSRDIDITELSSGEKQLLLILMRVMNCSDRNTILILDEPEISLHLKWQEMLIAKILSLHDKCQLIIATHSPAILMQGWMDCLVDMKNITTEIDNNKE